MKPIKSHIIVKVNATQKEEVVIENKTLLTAKRYSENFREKNPVLAYVESGEGEIERGMWIVCNYNHFEGESPYLLYDDMYSIPVDEEIYGWVDKYGNLNPLGGNIFIKQILRKTVIEQADDYQKYYDDRGFVLSGLPRYSEGELIFFYPFSNYEIVYTWEGKEHRVIKVYQDEVVGHLL